MRIRPASLPLQLLIFVVVPLLVLLVLVAFGGVALHQAAMRDELVHHNRQVVSGVAAELSAQLQQRQQVLAAVFSSDAATEPDQAAVDEASRWLTTLFDGGIALYAGDGRLLAATGSGKDWQTVASALPPQAASAFVPLIDPEHHATQIAVLVTARRNEQDVRVVGLVSLNALAFTNVVESLEMSGSTRLYLLGSDRTVLYHSDPQVMGEPYNRVMAQINQGHGTVETTDSEGRDVVATAAPVPAAGWMLVQEERWKETLSPVLRYSQAAPLVLVPGLLIAIGAVWFGIQRIVYPLRRLEARATELSWGDFGAVEQPVGGINEIRHLQATLQHMAKRVQAAQASMHHYIGVITHAQEEERQRLARELHDQTAQALVALDQRQQMLKPYLKDDPAAAALLAEIRAMNLETIHDLRRIVRALRPVYLEELGLAPALEMLVRDLGPSASAAVRFEKMGTPRRLAPEHEMALYRIAQEALTNAWRHSGASQIALMVQFEEDQVTIAVRDNGQGFMPPRHPADLGEGESKHFGIMGMHERAALINAHLQIQSEPGGGTMVTVRAPIMTTPDAGLAST